MISLTRSFILLCCALGPLKADEQVNTLAELRQMQFQVKAVVAKNTAATVGLFSPATGSSGSGVIVSEDGLILTAAHVVEGMEEVNVIFPRGHTVAARVLGLDRTRDQGMVQIMGEGKWPHVEVGPSLEMLPGSWVVALGHPTGYDPTRTPPVRLGRVQSRNAVGFFTTDCKLIGGDSGGPLFNLEGDLVGIHSSIGGARTTSINNHAGTNDFKVNWERLLKGERWGAYGEMVTEDGPILGVVFYPRPLRGGGVLLETVAPGGPADQAGLREGDIILAVEGERVSDMHTLALRIAQRRVGDTISLAIRRGGRTFDTEATLIARKDLLK